MTEHLDHDLPEDLVRLWQQTALPVLDPKDLARRVARMAVKRFDRSIFWRNFREYAGIAVVVVFFGWQWATGGDRVQAAVGIAGALFVGWYLWSRHRRLTRLDPSADARAYQAALLARIDDQVRLLSQVRYWYLLPLYLPGLWTVAQTWRASPVAAVVGWLVITGTFALIAWLNEKVAVDFLKKERARVESLYE